MDLNKIFSGVICLMIMSSCGNKKNTDNPAALIEYPVQAIERQNVTIDSEYPVTIKGQEDVEIRPRIDGFIDAIFIDEGSAVKKDQVLFKINSPSAEQALLSAQALVSSSSAALNTAKLNIDRTRPLVEKGIISKVQLATYEDAYKQAQALLKQAQASLMNAQATIDWTKVKSPVDGVVGEISFRQGSLVDKSNILTTVSSIGNVYAYFSMNEKQLMTFLNNLEGQTQAEKIKHIPPVKLVLADGAEYPEAGKIETITGSINSTTGTANLRAEFSNQNKILRSGTSGKIYIPTQMNNIFVIPQKATFAQQNKVLVYTLQGDSAVQRVITVVPYDNGASFIVTDGLSDGDKIISDGLSTLKNGKKIKPQN